MEGFGDGLIYEPLPPEEDYPDEEEALYLEPYCIGEFLIIRDEQTKKEWNLYNTTHAVVLWYSEQGFITAEEFTKEDFIILQAEYNIV